MLFNDFYIHHLVQMQNSTYILGSILMCLFFYNWPLWHICTQQENLSFFTVIFGLVFTDSVIFYMDCIGFSSKKSYGTNVTSG